jgi:hypothetical protein
MSTPVFITIDTEFAHRHYAAGLGVDEIYERSLEPAGVGLSYQLELFRRHGLKACFFIDPMPALVFGLDPVKRMVETVMEAGQGVQLHLHPHWVESDADDRTRTGRFHMHQYSLAEQRAMLEQASDLLVRAGAPRPIAFRAGNYAANDDTLAALADLGFIYDSSHNGAHADLHSRISLPPRLIAPVEEKVVEVPVTVIEDAPGSLRTAQLCALSVGEMMAALEHAFEEDHAAMTIVSHGFELANRQGTLPNNMHVRRFEALCERLEANADVLPTTHFRDMPKLKLDADDTPLAPDNLRTRWRQAEQLWSNWVSERVA